MNPWRKSTTLTPLLASHATVLPEFFHNFLEKGKLLSSKFANQPPHKQKLEIGKTNPQSVSQCSKHFQRAASAVTAQRLS